ncbi:coproporphyrinogen III oxidase, partial [Staphylococcus pasteuri]
NVFGQTINDLKNRKLIEEKSDYIYLTERGKVIGNEVFEAFLLNI